MPYVRHRISQTTWLILDIMLRSSVVDKKVSSPWKSNNYNFYIYEFALLYDCGITRINKEHFALNTRHDHDEISLSLSRLDIFLYNGQCLVFDNLLQVTNKFKPLNPILGMVKLTLWSSRNPINISKLNSPPTWPRQTPI